MTQDKLKPSRSKQIFRIILLTGTIISLFYVPWIFIRIWLTPLPNNLKDHVEKATQYGFDGIILYVDQISSTSTGGEPEASASKTYVAGWHDKEAQIPTRPDALFKIASIGKLYDAVTIAKLVHKNLLELDKTIVDYFPELEGRIEYADSITLRMIVQHRSGIPNVTDVADFWNDPPSNRTEALQRILDLPADFEPGTEYAYSNTNYILLGLLVEKVTGGSMFEVIKEEILNPLNLSNTFQSLHEVDPDELMSGYYVGVGDLKSTDYGSMIATAEDVGIFLRALNDGTLFEPGEQEIYSSIYVYEHTGLIPGYQSIARYHKELDAVVIQFTNTTNFEGYEWTTSEILYNRAIKILKREAD